MSYAPVIIHRLGLGLLTNCPLLKIITPSFQLQWTYNLYGLQIKFHLKLVSLNLNFVD